MKVLIATFWPLPYPGGLWTFISQLKKGLEQNGAEVDVLSNSPDHSSFRLLNEKSSISKHQFTPLLETMLRVYPAISNEAWLYQMELEQYCMELSAAHCNLHSYDIIHAQDPISAKVFRRIKPPGTPLITSIHGLLSGEMLHAVKHKKPHLSTDEIKEQPLFLYYRELERLGYEASDRITASSQWLCSQITSPFPSVTNTVLHLPYGHDPAPPIHYQQSQQSPGNKTVILFTGRLERLKGLQDLITALEILKKYRSDWECWIVGDGSYKSHLQRISKRIGLQNDIRFLGTHQDINPFLQQADLFVLPSLQDNQPYSVMEAVFADVPVIVSNAAGLPEMVSHQKTGLIFTSGDPYSLYTCLDQMISHVPMRRYLAENAKKTAENKWSYQSMINAFFSSYEELLNNKKTGGKP